MLNADDIELIGFVGHDKNGNAIKADNEKDVHNIIPHTVGQRVTYIWRYRLENGWVISTILFMAHSVGNTLQFRYHDRSVCFQPDTPVVHIME